MRTYLGVSIIFTCMLLLFTTSGNAEQKMHELKNYYVVYDISGNTTGTKKHASHDYGRKQCWIEVSDTNIMGNSVKKNEKVITTIENGDQWIITINLDDNTGTKMKNPMYQGLAATMEGKNPKELSEQLMKQMGGKIIGEKTINNEKCTEWTLMGGAKTCVTEDLIAVESGADMAGITIREVATEVKRNDPGPKGICDIGNAKIKEIDLGQIMGR